MNTISALELAGRREGKVSCIDVRSPREFATGHIPRAINIPLDEIEKRTADLPADRPLALICQMGQRAEMAATLLGACRNDLVVLDGGTKAWKDAGFPLVASVKARWSLERQVRFTAGLIVLTGSVLAATVSPYFLALTGFIGAGLTFAGATDLCPMAMLLARLPWNISSRCPIANSGTEQISA